MNDRFETRIELEKVIMIESEKMSRIKSEKISSANMLTSMMEIAPLERCLVIHICNRLTMIVTFMTLSTVPMA